MQHDDANDGRYDDAPFRSRHSAIWHVHIERANVNDESIWRFREQAVLLPFLSDLNTGAGKQY